MRRRLDGPVPGEPTGARGARGYRPEPTRTDVYGRRVGASRTGRYVTGAGAVECWRGTGASGAPLERRRTPRRRHKTRPVSFYPVGTNSNALERPQGRCCPSTATITPHHPTRATATTVDNPGSVSDQPVTFTRHSPGRLPTHRSESFRLIGQYELGELAKLGSDSPVGLPATSGRDSSLPGRIAPDVPTVRAPVHRSLPCRASRCRPTLTTGALAVGRPLLPRHRRLSAPNASRRVASLFGFLDVAPFVRARGSAYLMRRRIL